MRIKKISDTNQKIITYDQTRYFFNNIDINSNDHTFIMSSELQNEKIKDIYFFKKWHKNKTNEIFFSLELILKNKINKNEEIRENEASKFPIEFLMIDVKHICKNEKNIYQISKIKEFRPYNTFNDLIFYLPNNEIDLTEKGVKKEENTFVNMNKQNNQKEIPLKILIYINEIESQEKTLIITRKKPRKWKICDVRYASFFVHGIFLISFGIFIIESYLKNDTNVLLDMKFFFIYTGLVLVILFAFEFFVRKCKQNIIDYGLLAKFIAIIEFSIIFAFNLIYHYIAHNVDWSFN